MRWSGVPLPRENLLRIVFSAISLAFLCVTHAAAPPLDGFFPAGAARGTTNTVTAIGKFDSWPPRVWVSGTGVELAAETNKGKFIVTIAPDAEPGARLVRLYNNDGASDPRFFVVGAGREVVESEPNNHFAKPEPIAALPVTINGRFDKNGDVDSFAINMLAGQWLEARVDAYTLMSKVDAVLRLVSTNGQQLAWNHDFVTLDPRLVWQSPVNQPVVLQIFGFAHPPASEIAFTGGEAVAYRLRLSLTNSGLAVCDSTETHSNAPPAIQPIQLPAEIRGNIARGDKEDRFQFTAAKNEFIEATIEAAAFGSRLDAWLKIEDATGNQLARSDDADGSPDPRLEWKVPTNGTYVLALGSVTHRGGNDCCYRLSVKRAVPDFRATLATSSLVLTSGTTNDLKIDFKRLRGLTNELIACARELPPGVTSVATNLPAKDGSAALRLVADTNAPSFQGPIQIVISNSVTSEQRPVSFELITRGETGFARLLVEKDTHFWLTVRPESETKKKASLK